MARHPVADVADLAEDGARAFAEIDGVDVAVVRIDGDLYAAANYCVHQGGPLCEGDLRGAFGVDDAFDWTYDDTEKYVVCPWHGWKFDLTTGRSTTNDRYAVPTYEVEVDDGQVYVVR